MMSESHFVDLDDLPDYLREPTKAVEPTNGLYSLEEMGRRYAQRVLAKLGGNKIKAAGVLGISRAKLYRMLASADTAKILDNHESSGEPPFVAFQ
jgi:transcriptional regulator with PAS, ATPase and Fis domain